MAVGALPPSTGGALIPGSAVFGFGNYGVALDGGGLMTSTATGLQIQPPPHAGAVRLTVDDGHTALPIVDGVVTIPLVGPQAGCLCFHVTVPVASASAQPAAIDLLDVGCRFHFDDAGWPGMGLFTSLRYPVFDTSSAGVAFQASMDPLAPLDPVRTRWAFDASQTLASFYRTNLGHAVTLAPAAGSGLVFAPRPRGTAAALRDPLTMVPDGPFALAVPAAGSGVRAQLQCGISGAEFVDITGQSAVLTFVAGQPAFAPSFMPDPTAPPAGTGLTSSPGNAGILAPSVLSTAWAAVSSAKVGLAYHAQPDGAALYGGTVTQGLFPYFQVMAEALPTTPADSRSTSYPLVPYAGLVALEVPGGDFSPYTGLETQVLGPTRRGAIYANHGPPAAAAPGTLEAITPQGLLATFSADHAYWSSLELAQAGAEQLAFENIVDPLKSALFSSHQFIVISLPSAFQAYFSTNNTLPIDGWRFQMDPGLWGQHGTILIVKNCDKSLANLVSDTGTWALGATFNTSTAATQATLQEIFADAAAALDDPTTPIPAYANFVNTVVGDPGWNGVLFLNCPVPLGGLPDALAALAAGIDASQFYAHHFGINQTPIADTTLTMNDSSLFGLIRYDGASGDGVPPGQQYGFLVNSLYVLFANSLVTTFSSTVTVTLEQLFGAPATQQSPSGGVPSSSLLLTGVLQRHGSAESYVFGESTPTTFTLNNAVLGSVGITQASFSTGATPPAGGGPLTGPQSYRFAFQGALAFNALPGPDLFSFDDLAFANLGVVMTFDASSGNPPSFAFESHGHGVRRAPQHDAGWRVGGALPAEAHGAPVVVHAEAVGPGLPGRAPARGRGDARDVVVRAVVRSAAGDAGCPGAPGGVHGGLRAGVVAGAGSATRTRDAHHDPDPDAGAAPGVRGDQAPRARRPRDPADGAAQAPDVLEPAHRGFRGGLRAQDQRDLAGVPGHDAPAGRRLRFHCLRRPGGRGVDVDGVVRGLPARPDHGVTRWTSQVSKQRSPPSASPLRTSTGRRSTSPSSRP